MFLRKIHYSTALAAISVLFTITPGSAQEKKTVGLAVANLQADFFNQIKQSVGAEAKAKGVELIVADAKGDAATQVDQMQDLITRGVKAIIYIPAGATAAGVPVKRPKKLIFRLSTSTVMLRTPLAILSSPPIASVPHALLASTFAKSPEAKPT